MRKNESNKTYWKDIISDADEWLGLKITSEGSKGFALKIESGTGLIFRISLHNLPILWARIDGEYYGVWILLNQNHWQKEQMPISPIHANSINYSLKENNKNRFWAKHFAEQLWLKDKPILPEGNWIISENPKPFSGQLIIFPSVNETTIKLDKPTWIDWFGGEQEQNCYGLKNDTQLDLGRVNRYRKLVRSKECPPILLWFLRPLDSFLLLDGHCRLKAFLDEKVEPEFLILYEIKEIELPDSIDYGKQRMADLGKRQMNPRKPKLSDEKVNELIKAFFDNRPISVPKTRAIFKPNLAFEWEQEIIKYSKKINGHHDNIKFMLNHDL